MRTLILSIVCVFTFNTLFAQQSDLALLDFDGIKSESTSLNNHKTHSTDLNFDYLKLTLTEESPNIITEWKHRIINYDLKNNSVFDDSEKAIYRINYKNKQVNIIAIYNNQGDILSTKETYKNIKLPLELRVKISKQYPDYAFLKNTYHTTYNSKSGIDKQFYQVQIVNGNNKRTLKFDKNFNTI